MLSLLRGMVGRKLRYPLASVLEDFQNADSLRPYKGLSFYLHATRVKSILFDQHANDNDNSFLSPAGKFGTDKGGEFGAAAKADVLQTSLSELEGMTDLPDYAHRVLYLLASASIKMNPNKEGAARAQSFLQRLFSSSLSRRKQQVPASLTLVNVKPAFLEGCGWSESHLVERFTRKALTLALNVLEISLDADELYLLLLKLSAHTSAGGTEYVGLLHRCALLCVRSLQQPWDNVAVLPVKLLDLALVLYEQQAGLGLVGETYTSRHKRQREKEENEREDEEEERTLLQHLLIRSYETVMRQGRPVVISFKEVLHLCRNKLGKLDLSDPVKRINNQIEDSPNYSELRKKRKNELQDQ